MSDETVELLRELTEAMVFVISRGKLPEDMKPEVGEQLRFRQPDGDTLSLTVTDVSEENVTLDANHPLAGKDLIFDIEFVEVV